MPTERKKHFYTLKKHFENVNLIHFIVQNMNVFKVELSFIQKVVNRMVCTFHFVSLIVILIVRMLFRMSLMLFEVKYWKM